MPADFDGAVAYARSRLGQELAPELTYHSLVHTFDDVMPAASRLAARYGVGELEANLLAVAAAFHDIGWVTSTQEHEMASIAIAREALPSFGFSPQQVETVAGMILATRIPQSPTTLLEQILADADLDSLGREDFWQRTGALREEMENHGMEMADSEWYRYVLGFLQDHSYFTDVAQSMRRPLKRKHMCELERLLSELAGES